MKFNSLKNQIIVIFLTLIFVIQIAGLIPIQFGLDKNVRNVVDRELEIGERVFLNLLQNNTDNIRRSAKVMVADYGFRDAVASNDQETIASALDNFRSRIDAQIAVLLPANSDIAIASGNISEEEAPTAIKQLINASNAGDMSDFDIFNEIPYQLILVPIKAPNTIGWMMIGFEIDNALAAKLQNLSHLQVTFLQKINSEKWLTHASTLSADEHVQLIDYFTKDTQRTLDKTEFHLGEKVFDSKTLVLHDDGSHQFLVILQRSITEEIKNFNTLKYTLLVFVFIGMGIFAVATVLITNRIVSPLSKLAQSAKQLEEGRFSEIIETSRTDEIGKLSQSFNAMREAVLARESQIKRLAFSDEITDLPNRIAFMQKLKKSISAYQHRGQQFSVLVLNIDRFKQVNKILGREMGDALLANVGNIIQSEVRSNNYVARLGADEFGIILFPLNQTQASKVAERLKYVFEEPVNVVDQKIDVSIGIGIAVYPEHGETDEILLNHAESALRVSKQRNSEVVVFDKVFEKGVQQNLLMATELKDAIQSNQLALYLQPKINIETKQGYAAEALVRWVHPEKGMIFPDQFIPFAEQTGLIQGITLWMIEEACRVHMAYKQDGINLTIAVNISTRDLISSDFPEKLANCFQQYGVNYDAISLEITESSIMDDPVRAEATLQKLSQMGLKIAIDDFGTGYSSLGYLKRLPVQELKIDKSFVMNMANNENDSIIVRSTVDLGHNLNMKVVAEGVENLDVWNLLDKMGCDYGQGYFMGKPMPEKEFKAWLVKWEEQIKTMTQASADKPKAKVVSIKS